jgi:AcrR family transcriptional regulator
MAARSQRSGTPQVRRRLNAAARRETILDAATSAFTTAGYEGTRVSAIAEMVGVTEPVIFQNFGTKADLFAAVLERASMADANHVSPVDTGEDALAVIAHLLTPAVHDQLHGSGGLGVLYAIADARSEPVIRDAFQRALALLVETLAVILRHGQADGSVRDDVDAATLAWLVLSFVRAREFRRVHTPRPSPALEDQLLAAELDTLRSAGE